MTPEAMIAGVIEIQQDSTKTDPRYLLGRTIDLETAVAALAAQVDGLVPAPTSTLAPQAPPAS